MIVLVVVVVLVLVIVVDVAVVASASCLLPLKFSTLHQYGHTGPLLQ